MLLLTSGAISRREEMLNRSPDFALGSFFVTMAICTEAFTLAYRCKFASEAVWVLPQIFALALFAGGIVSYFAFRSIGKERRKPFRHPVKDAFIAVALGILYGLTFGCILLCICLFA